MKKIRVRVYTFGCRLNQVESNAIAEKFEQAGFVLTDGDADVYIINSCTVTGKAEQKMRRLVREVSRRGGLCILTGCAADGESAHALESAFENVIVVKMERKSDILKLAAEYPGDLHLFRKAAARLLSGVDRAVGSDAEQNNRFAFFASRFQKHHRAFLKVQDGCDRHCSFCAVCIARGKPFSLNADEAVRRFEALQDEGYKEICLTGANLALYDFEGEGLAGLLGRLGENVRPDVMVRLSSLEPDLVSERLLDALRFSFICPYFHIPIQSASGKVLSLTGRHYRMPDLERLISSLRSVKENPFISADIMTGLPGEGDEEAQETYGFLERMRLSSIHVFPFSKRAGTRAFFQSAPPQRIRDERAQRLRLLSNRLSFDYANSFCGKMVSGVFEHDECEKRANFTSDNYLKVFVEGANEACPGERRSVRILDISEVEEEHGRSFRITGSIAV